MSKMRSPNYPAYSLATCVDWAEKIWDREGRTPLSSESIAVAAGYKGLSGPSRTAIASLKKFGLLEDVSGGLRISNLTLNILHPDGGRQIQESLKEAALKPGLFSQLFQTHAEASVQSITAHLITKLGFSQTGARTCAEAFRETIQYASLEKPSAEERETDLPEALERQEFSFASPTSVGPSASLPTTIDIPQFRWPLTNGLVATVTLSASDFTEEDLELLREYLNLAKRSVSVSR